ncbi:hypothetical protein BMW23_1090 [Bodo saltans virus]|uniref:Uncharacterized protein n=1 Tax=Bodo saltans virus TaxID=2024608 RepID=A0A2H4UW61_9VIRU|nr:hypothetical protein QJ851_gp1071 [Bodo saltans virus]ATZ81134.1 hypothetical protein BMW23_1090 [Bodo saltans virus]
MDFEYKYVLINPQIYNYNDNPKPYKYGITHHSRSNQYAFVECAYVLFNDYEIIKSHGFLLKNSLPSIIKNNLNKKTGISTELEDYHAKNLLYCVNILTDILKKNYAKVIIINYKAFYNIMLTELHLTQNIYLKNLIARLNELNIIEIDKIEHPVYIAITDCINVAKMLMQKC